MRLSSIGFIFVAVLMWVCGAQCNSPQTQKNVQPELVLQLGHRELTSLTLSNDGKLLATGGSDEVKLWSTRSRSVIRTWQIPELASAATFLPDSKSIVCTTQKQIYIFDVSSGKRLRVLDLNKEFLSSDASVFIQLQSDTKARLFNTRTGKFLIALETVCTRSNVPVHPLAPFYFSPDKSLIAQVGGTVRIWNMRNGRLWREFSDPRGDAPNEGVTEPVAFSPNGRLMATVGADPQFVMPSLAVDEYGNERDYMERYVHNWFIKLWDYRSGKLLRMLPAFADVEVTTLAFSLDGKKLISATPWEIQIQNVATGKVELKFAHSGYGGDVALSSDKLLMASSDNRRGTFSMWNMLTGKEMFTLAPPARTAASGLTIAPDGKTLAVRYSDDRIRFWNLRSGHLSKTQPGGSPDNRMRFGPDNKTLILSTSEQDAKAIPDFLPPRNYKTEYIVSSNGKQVVIVRKGDQRSEVPEQHLAELSLCDIQTKTMLWKRNYEDSIYSTLFSPDSRLLVVWKAESDSHAPSHIQLLDAATGQVRHTLESGKLIPWKLTMSADSSTLAGGTCEDNSCSLRVWNLKSGRLKREIRNLTSPANETALSTNGRLLAASHSNGDTNVFDTSNGKLLLTWNVFSSPLNSNPTNQWITYTPDGFYDGSKGAEKFIRWRVSNELLPAAKFKTEKHRPDMIAQALHPAR